jgi:copper chaperone CopZ
MPARGSSEAAPDNERAKGTARRLAGMSVTLTVEEMGCDGCEEIVEDALGEVDGVESASADHEESEVTVEGDADEDDLVEAVDFAGYEATVEG